MSFKIDYITKLHIHQNHCANDDVNQTQQERPLGGSHLELHSGRSEL